MSNYRPGLQERSFPYHVDTTSDHWWPKGLQRLWVNQEGYVSCIKPTGEVDQKSLSKRSKGFAHKRGGHKITLENSPWNHTFEPEFDECDNNGPPILKHLGEKLPGKDQELFDLVSESNTANTLVLLCFSLLIRSPAFRYRHSQAGEAFGLGYNEETGKANISHFWSHAKDIDLTKCNLGKLLLLQSDEAEFCFGDGLYDTVFTRPLGWRYQGTQLVADLVGEALVPLLPNLCAYLCFKRNGLGTTTHLVQVNAASVTGVNDLTQIYSKERLFFRKLPPALTAEYRRGEYSSVSQKSLPLITELRGIATEY